MINRKTKLIAKILNNLTENGKKIKSEKILLQTVKEIQKPFKKQSKRILQLSLILSSPLFKFSSINQKKRRKKKDKITPTFITKSENRISFAIRSIVRETRTSKIPYFFQALKHKIIESSNLNGSVINTKNIIQKKILLNKRLFKYYK